MGNNMGTTGTWFNISTGEITGFCDISTPEVLDSKSSPDYRKGNALILGRYDYREYYVSIETNTPAPTLKTGNPATIANQTISNIHNPSTVDCGELGVFTVTDGVFDFTVDTPGEYDITVKSVPYFDKTFTVVIT